MEQFRKFSTGSSYSAILDEDVAKTLVPLAEPIEQDKIAQLVMQAYHQREELVRAAKVEIDNAVIRAMELLTRATNDTQEPPDDNTLQMLTIESIREYKSRLLRTKLL